MAEAKVASEDEVDRILGDIFEQDPYAERHYGLLPDGSVSTKPRGITLRCPFCREKPTRLRPIVKIEGIDGTMLFDGCVRCLDRHVQDPLARAFVQIALATPPQTGFRA